MTTTAVAAPRRALAGVCIGFALVILDANVLNVAVPTLQRELAASSAGVLWAVDAYTVAFAALLLSTGVLCDRWGPRLAFLAGLAVFALGSVAAGAAPSIGVLVAARVVQGVGAALLAPASLALIHALYPAGRERAGALAAWASVSGVAFAAGPLVGGGLVQVAGWRSVFWLNLPVGLVAVVLAVRHVRGGRRPDARPGRRPDVVGQLLAVVALTALTAGLIEAGHGGWRTTPVVVLCATAAVALAGFAVTQRRRATPLVPAAAVRSPPLRAGLLAGAAFNFAMYGSLYVYTLHLQQQRGFWPLLTGCAFLPLTLVHTPVAARLAGPWTGARGPRAPLAAGLACTVVGSAGFLIAAGEPYWVLAASLAVFGVGSGLITTSMTALVLAHVPGESVGVSCGLLNAARQLGGVLGVALLGSLVADRTAAAVPLAEVFAVGAVVLALAVVMSYRAEREAR